MDNETGERKQLEADGVFVAIGHRPNTEFLGGQLELDAVGYVVTKGNTSETSVAACSRAGM
ncbi:hypothetical protein GCM10025858_29370 [Alicyclobacillus sacchari]|nr:hypothetical protein GCM10025858_29370 [Alicyclobacillus sacchari]